MIATVSYHLVLHISPLPVILTIYHLQLCPQIHRRHTLQFKKLLLPPPVWNPGTRFLLRRQKQVHNWSGRNGMCDCVLEAGNVGLYLLQSRLRHGLHQKEVHPRTILFLPRLPPRQYASHPVVVATQCPANAQGHCPCLQHIQKNRLHAMIIYSWLYLYILFYRCVVTINCVTIDFFRSYNILMRRIHG